MKTLTEFKQLLEYRPEEGVFYWRVNHRHPKARIGMQAGRITAQGRMQIGVDKKQYFVHRLVWLFETGAWPEGMLDHVNGDPLDNRYHNLRPTNFVLNGQNQRAHRPNNKSAKLLGVSWHKHKKQYIASIKVYGKKKHLGYFDTADTAHAAYVTAKRIYHEAGML